MELQELLGHFEEVVEEGDGYLMRCPAHGDSKPSLKMMLHDDGEGTAKAGLSCRVGCSNNDVVKASGLPWRAFFRISGGSNVGPAARPELVTGPPVTRLAMYIDACRDRWENSPAEEYAAERFGIGPELAARLELGYDDGTGFAHTHGAYNSFPRLVVPFKNVSGQPHAVQGRDLSGKAPDQQRWVGATNPDGMAWGRYAWFDSGHADGPVIVAEGPGDGLTLVAAGYDALAIRGAALGASEGLADALQGRDVVAAGDRDKGGRAFNEKLSDSLAEHGITVRVLEIPDAGPKADVSDWRKSRPETFEQELAAAIEAARPMETEVTGTVVETIEKSTGVAAVTQEEGRQAQLLLREAAQTYGTTDRGLPSDVANAHALVAWTAGRIKFAKGIGFHVWNGRVWEPTEDVRFLAHAMGAALMLAGSRAESSGFTATARIDNLLKELRGVPAVFADADDFDSKHHLLSFRNGTVDLRNGAIRPHSPDDMMTALIDVNYDPNAQAPRWEKFCEEIMPGMEDMPGYLQRLIGYGITGYATEQCFAVLHGVGANGKSVFSEVVKGTFRAITKTTRVATFEEKQSGAIPNDIAALREARLVLASEGSQNKPMSEDVIKNSTGDEEMTARFLRKEEFSFLPKFLLLLSTNHKPQFKGQDAGLWRRVRLIPFNRYFEPHERDHGLKEKLLAEKEGIVAWAVRGAVDWYKSGLRDPDVVTEATREYKESSNPLDGFLPGAYEITGDPDDKVLGSELYLDYKSWADAEGLQMKDVWRRNSLYRAVENLQVPTRKTDAGKTFFKIRKAPGPDYPDTPEMFKEGA